MKKCLEYLALIIPVFFAACDKEESASPVEEGDRQFSIVAELPQKETFTRATTEIPADYQLRSIAEVWSTAAGGLVYKEEKIVAGGEVNISFDFTLPGGNYECLIWSDIISKTAASSDATSGSVAYTHYEDLFYDTSDLHNVKIKGDGTEMMDTDLCDAYMAKIELGRETSAPVSATLARPFGKLTVSETVPEQISAMASMEVSYTVPSAFNVSTGEPLAETIEVKATKEFADGNTSGELFSAYVFAPSAADGSSMDIISFIFNMDDGSVIECQVPSFTIFIKRNVQTDTSGELIKEGAEEPLDPQVGYFFFKDGTCGPELTEENKDDCVGIVYAVGPQEGDNIGNYGPDNADKRILGYVMALKEIGISEEYADFVGSCQGNGRPWFYRGGLTSDQKFPAEDPIDRENHDGYAKTERYLNSELYKAAPENYIALYLISDWRQKNKVENASDWYIPTIRQLMTIIGGFYGHPNVNQSFPAVTADPALQSSLQKAKDMGVAGGLGTRVICNITIGPAQNPVAVEMASDGSGYSSYKENRSGDVPARVHPVLTILQ